MSVSVIPIQAVAAQDFDILLSNQPCNIHIYQKQGNIFFDLSVNSNPLMTGAVARDRSYLIRSEHLGFIGDLFFCDLHGKDDPMYPELGTRWVLVYEVAE